MTKYRVVVYIPIERIEDEVLHDSMAEAVIEKLNLETMSPENIYKVEPIAVED